MTELLKIEPNAANMLKFIVGRSNRCPTTASAASTKCIIDRLRKTTYAYDGSEIYTADKSDMCGGTAPVCTDKPKGATCSPQLATRPAMEPGETFCTDAKQTKCAYTAASEAAGTFN